jgi:hypothetical protein
LKTNAAADLENAKKRKPKATSLGLSIPGNTAGIRAPASKIGQLQRHGGVKTGFTVGKQRSFALASVATLRHECLGNCLEPPFCDNAALKLVVNSEECWPSRR